jgi:hypothetical protein
MSSKATKAEPIIIKVPEIKILKVTVVGTTPLVTHAWGKKLDALEAGQKEKDSGTAPKKRRKVRDPMAECKDAMYWIGPGQTKPAVQAVAFKRAMVGACRYVEGLDMVYARGLFFVLGDLLPLKGKWRMRTDPVRVPPKTGSADVRYRPEFPKWEVELSIQYNANLLNEQQILNLLALAGLHQGVGEMRPSAREKDFTFGMFTIKSKKGRATRAA